MLLKKILTLAAGLTLALSATAAGKWPSRPVRIIVPAAAGSAPDAAMRILGERMASALGQPVIVDNRPGAGGVVAMKTFQAGKDDHTLLFVITSTSAIAPVTLQAAASFDYLRDLKPVVRLAQTPLMIVASPNTPSPSLQDAIAAARKQPGAIAFGTPPPSTLGSLAVLWLTDATGAKFNAVPFVRPAESLTAVASGDTQYFIDGVSVALPFLRSNKVKPVAVLSATKLPGLEAYPLGVETVKNFEVVGRFGLMALPELPAEASEPLTRAALDALKDTEVVARLTNLGFYPEPGTSADYLRSLKSEIELWHRIIKQAGITAQ